MKLLLLVAGKPVFALLTGAAFYTMPVAHHQMIEIEEMQLEQMQELEQELDLLERQAAEDRARDGAEPEENGAEPEEKAGPGSDPK